MSNEDIEFEVRLAAVELVEEGWETSGVATELSRTERWVRKWVSRYETGGEVGLVSRSRRPYRSPNRLNDTVISEILKVRGELEEHRHANVGAKAIRSRMRRCCG